MNTGREEFIDLSFNTSLREFLLIKEFQGILLSDLEKIIHTCHQQCYKAGEEIVRYQDHTNSVFFILKGIIRIHYYSLSGDEVILCDLPEGEMFGELTAIDGLARSATAVALKDSLLASLPSSAFLELVHTYPEFCTAILKRLVGQVRRLTERVFDFSTLAVRNRIHAELLRLTHKNKVSENLAIISPAPTHEELANYVSTRREEVSREISVLARQGIIECRGRAWHILDVAKLAHMVKDVRGSFDTEKV
ncbi:MAG TPA: Crp/Fnr family transcriptional regulator [Nitrosomonas sp.]|nr:Crp/Fnr family transcriptional regulator [Nitrosomonas sp.]HMW19431.1 Crp/Fnr family transcriptional regulator [Nitrosomonas sp.]HMW69567.1 Crp/Fnr family transcriptional regulator [Nitrosomonas sp.]HMY61229.1 Crp/Fnr family transcriptional regulator [Nitrosomonas sp.]HMY90139.1 Crp/Fnr family transcriptional regulator [Nitrosomonas sp.]